MAVLLDGPRGFHINCLPVVNQATVLIIFLRQKGTTQQDSISTLISLILHIFRQGSECPKIAGAGENQHESYIELYQVDICQKTGQEFKKMGHGKFAGRVRSNFKKGEPPLHKPQSQK